MIYSLSDYADKIIGLEHQAQLDADSIKALIKLLESDNPPDISVLVSFLRVMIEDENEG